ncbi:unnamed protein product [Bursaphelenchus okinawaensis]|uniref:Uncharacterized protein n=1 Tax=Bursaphelenchus okinawaensis TaxID=465554 RepID=A0A811LR07_9BILA|nr:unnamed protein product [Bursaphelenchus okinawaensis]CAG9127489.1 unnamed protein product [Bursaphelenchus okinawaensis]
MSYLPLILCLLLVAPTLSRPQGDGTATGSVVSQMGGGAAADPIAAAASPVAAASPLAAPVAPAVAPAVAPVAPVVGL